ncbi:MAG TPA: hypothetical protein VGP07_09440 [Polyangia bacterium]
MGLLGLLAASCGKSTPAPTIASFCAQKAEKECGSATSGVAYSCGATVTACTTARAAVCTATAEAEESLTRPFRADAIGNCLNKTAAAYTAATITPDLTDAMNDACARVFSGSNKVLTTCASDYDCDTNLICDRTVCAKRVSVATDAPCNNPGETCPAAQFCGGVYPTQQCKAKAALAAACDVATPCLDNLRCLSGACMAKVGVRGACATDADCDASAPYCDAYNGHLCFLGFTPASPGGTNECATFGGGTSGAGGAGGGAGGSSGAGGAGGSNAGNAGGSNAGGAGGSNAGGAGGSNAGGAGGAVL